MSAKNNEVKLINKADKSSNITFQPLSVANWDDFEHLFGEKGASGGCWCMLWRLTASEFKAQKGDGNRKAMQRLAQSKTSPGILAFDANTPIGWCAIAPREDYPKLNASRILKPVDEKPVWSVSCFFINKDYRRKGISVKLLNAAAEYAKSKGAKIIEGYPVDPSKKDYPPVFAWTGISKAFEKADFKECMRRSPTRPIMRREVS